MYLLNQMREGKEVRDARYNYAISSYLINESPVDEPIMRFYINQPAVIIGKNQNAFAEVDSNYLDAKDIQLVRRSSGGGAVYHDEGTLIYGFNGPADNGSYQDFSRFTQPIIQALKKLGVTKATFGGRNDLLIGEKKFSGTSMLVTDRKVIVGGTLLLDVDYDTLEKVLTPNKKKLVAKGVKSVKSRVTALRPHLAAEFRDISIEDFRQLLIQEVFQVQNISDIPSYSFSNEQWARIDEIVKEKFGNWEWNFGHSGKMNYQRDHRFPFGTMEFQLAVNKGVIENCMIYGDFFASGNVTEIEQALIGTTLSKEAIVAALESFDLANYFGPVSVDEIASVILS
ncbi:lipoate--protein ligase [Candidatus Enterococcus willemsii]|nr:lipoate--protein ligase [Enterococcus sp. CU12B]